MNYVRTVINEVVILSLRNQALIHKDVELEGVRYAYTILISRALKFKSIKEAKSWAIRNNLSEVVILGTKDFNEPVED